MGLRQVWPGELPASGGRPRPGGRPLSPRPPALGGPPVIAQTARVQGATRCRPEVARARGAARVLGGSCRLQRVTRRLDS